jgi:hypothetical protein
MVLGRREREHGAPFVLHYVAENRRLPHMRSAYAPGTVQDTMPTGQMFLFVNTISNVS